LFVVEGDSAGGSAKQGRDRKFQAILPLKGKILNVEKASTSKMLENEEIKTIIAALGAGLGQENFDIEKLRYHKVIIMTDADVDGSHIRTLLMTFFFRHMRPLIESGFLCLAQPPLYLVRKGKTNTYLKNEKELENFLLKKISEEVVFYLDKDKSEELKGANLIQFIKLLNKKNSLIENIEKRGMPRDITTKLIELIKNEDTLKDEQNSREIAEKLQTLSCCRSAVPIFDEEYSTYTLALEYELNGVIMQRSIDWDYLTGPLFAQVNETYEKLKSYPTPPYIFRIGKNGDDGKYEFQVDNEKDLVSFLFENIKKGLYIQRYKGLGEMNPDQLWETTMNPENRILLKVNISDYLASETIFDTLMGSDANKRREFIMENALDVRNLDI
jgi:DNA gyrase subunit B